MKQLKLDIKFMHGFWGLSRKISSNLLKLTPVYILVFIAFGDSFLPNPLANVSYQTRTRINNVLIGSFIHKVADNLKNDKYDNKQIKRVSDQTEKEYGGGTNK